MDWERILKLIPGYDPIATAGDCWFEPDTALAAVSFFRHHLYHIEGALAGTPFLLEEWQQAIVGNLFGWKRKNARGKAVRRYRESLIFIPRKNGKTPLCAGIGLYYLFCEPLAGQQSYVAASTREQAGLLFRQCKGMIRQNPQLESWCRIYGGTAPGGQSQSIVRESLGSFLKVISGDSNVGGHGKTLDLGVIDELHEQQTRKLVDELRTSMASANKPEPLLVYATTSDYDREGSICNEIHDYACKVRDGIVEDQKFLPVIYETTKEEDWTSPEVWAKANPNLNVSVSLEYLERECARAKEEPTYENTFKRLHLNVKTEQAIRWLTLDKWDASDAAIFEPDLLGQPCWCGLDLSTTTDLSALAMVFKRETGGYQVLFRYWVPEANARKRERSDRVPYTQWIREGWITACHGDSIDYDVIRRDINALAKQYNIQEIACDRWNATQLITQLDGDGLTIFPFGQGFTSMTAPTKELERLISAGDLSCGQNPVTRWMASNVTVETDSAENYKPSKRKSSERIDGIVALIMGVGRAMLHTGPKQSIYETREMAFL